ncbi:hypothetical protein ELE36_11930 [Pseudolysobacter antarcticus]|uniref:DUF6869 domain-containing protein n=1 Tax=Pseudolysobacter antarcticus TaxID=2511995 RepID=A0A411HKS4_9GAMM|nr:hypothetical protein [Pseudolysobacter antarcticus]QBB71000.1 hypothetical protein ELE36_11930 [Pseudolysobacter antarcticus]
MSDSNRLEDESANLTGSFDFEWTVTNRPEQGWRAILGAVADARVEPYLGLLAAGPLEDLLSCHGEAFIERVEAEALLNPRFARVLGSVWQFQMSDEVWTRVQKVWDRPGLIRETKGGA